MTSSTINVCTDAQGYQTEASRRAIKLLSECLDLPLTMFYLANGKWT